MESKQLEEKCCRICRDYSGNMITPCRCTGSVKYIHEECLKTWLRYQGERREELKCELCDTVFKTKVTTSSKKFRCVCGKIGLGHCFILILILVVLAVLFLIMSALFKLLDDSQEKDKEVVVIIMIIACALPGLALLCLMMKILVEPCSLVENLEWVILDQNFYENEEITGDRVTDENFLFLEKRTCEQSSRKNKRDMTANPVNVDSLFLREPNRKPKRTV